MKVVALVELALVVAWVLYAFTFGLYGAVMDDDQAPVALVQLPLLWPWTRRPASWLLTRWARRRAGRDDFTISITEESQA